MLVFNLNSLCGSYLLGLIDTERIDHSIALANAHALEQRRRIVMLRMIAKAKLERDTQRADRVVVRLPAPNMRISDADELGVCDMQEVSMANRGPPNAIQDLSVSRNGDRLHSTLPLKRHAVIEERIKHVTTRALPEGAHDSLKVPIAGELLSELESTRRDMFLDCGEVLTGAAKIRFLLAFSATTGDSECLET
jgi:hypothetical protein